MVTWRAVGAGIVQLVETPPKLDRRPRRMGTLGMADPVDSGPWGWRTQTSPCVASPARKPTAEGRLGRSVHEAHPCFPYLVQCKDRSLYKCFKYLLTKLSNNIDVFVIFNWSLTLAIFETIVETTQAIL